MSGINDLPAVRRRHQARHEHYYIPYMMRIQCIGYIEEFFGIFLMQTVDHTPRLLHLLCTGLRRAR